MVNASAFRFSAEIRQKLQSKLRRAEKNKNSSAVNIVFNVFQDVSETSAMKTENIAKNRTAEEFKEAV